MAVDTITKRSAALRYGRGRTRQPEAASTAFVRGVGLGCWYPVPIELTYLFTTRATLRGQSEQRLTLRGQSNQPAILRGQSEQPATLHGASK